MARLRTVDRSRIGGEVEPYGRPRGLSPVDSAVGATNVPPMPALRVRILPRSRIVQRARYGSESSDLRQMCKRSFHFSALWTALQPRRLDHDALLVAPPPSGSFTLTRGAGAWTSRMWLRCSSGGVRADPRANEAVEVGAGGVVRAEWILVAIIGASRTPRTPIAEKVPRSQR